MKITLSIEMGEQKAIANLGFEALESMNYSLRDKPENSELFDILSHHASHNIRSSIAQKKNLPFDRCCQLIKFK